MFKIKLFNNGLMWFRWLAYADRRLVTQWRSLGGCHSEGPQSVTATVFHAAKALGKGLRDLSETVASSLTGGSPENTFTHSHSPEPCLKGVVTILDVEVSIMKHENIIYFSLDKRFKQLYVDDGYTYVFSFDMVQTVIVNKIVMLYFIQVNV